MFVSPLARPRLHVQARLDQPSPPRLVLLVGPPGAGLSTTLRALVDSTPHPTASLSLRSCPPDLSGLRPALALLGIPQAAPLDQPDLLGQPAILALDDAHYLFDAEGALLPAASWLLTLLDLPRLTLVLAAHTLPQVSAFARLALSGALVTLDATDLRFTATEAAALWQSWQPASTSDRQLLDLLALTEGWAAPLALGCQSGGADAHLLALLGLETVAAMADAAVLLRQLALLPELSPGLVAEFAPSESAPRLLAGWQRMGWVIGNAPMRVHPLLRPTLLDQLEPASRVRIARQAALWYGSQQQWDVAVAVLADAGAWPELRALLLEHADSLRAAQRGPDLIAWLARIPPPHRSPCLGLVQARCLADQGSYDAALLTVDGYLADSALNPTAQRELILFKASIEQLRGDHGRATALVRPYLADPMLPPLDQARALRIHGIGLVFQGDDGQALDVLQHAAELARSGGPSRLLGLTLADLGNTAARLGRYLLADRTLRLAHEVWTQLGSPPDLSLTLNLRALVALNAGHAGEAVALAQSAYDLAVHHGRGREIAGALATLGEVAFARQDWTEARRCFGQAEVESQRTGAIEGTNICYILAMQAHVARHLQDHRRLREVLDLLGSAQPCTPLDRAWIAAGQASGRTALAIGGGAALLRHALAELGPGSTLVTGMLRILLAQTDWLAGDLAGAQGHWAVIDELMLAGRGGLPALLEPIAQFVPALLSQARQSWLSPYAQRLGGAPAPCASAPLLHLHLLGRAEAIWQGQPVSLPRHGIELLALVLLAGPAGISGDDLRERLYGEPDASPHGLRKLLERVRKLMPEVIVLDGSLYRLNVPRDQLQADVLLVRDTPLSAENLAEIQAAATLSGQPFLPGNDDPWVRGERQALAQRGTDLWLALADLARERDAVELAVHAYREARALAPLHERALTSMLSLSLELGRHVEAVNVFLDYQRLLDDTLGLNPSPVVEALYRQALGA